MIVYFYRPRKDGKPSTGGQVETPDMDTAVRARQAFKRSGYKSFVLFSDLQDGKVKAMFREDEPAYEEFKAWVNE